MSEQLSKEATQELINVAQAACDAGVSAYALVMISPSGCEVTMHHLGSTDGSALSHVLRDASLSIAEDKGSEWPEEDDSWRTPDEPGYWWRGPNPVFVRSRVDAGVETLQFRYPGSEEWTAVDDSPTWGGPCLRRDDDC